MRNITKFFIAAMMILSIFFLYACDDNHRLKDLKKYVDDIKRVEGKNGSATTPVIQTPAPATYKADAFRDPFKSSGPAASNTPEKMKYPLQNYPLNSLQFVGTAIEGNRVLAFILTPDNMIYQVMVGDRVGNQGGKVIKIQSDLLSIMEKDSQPQNGTSDVQHIVTLQLRNQP
jgi:type IV pilus assembly protein PilP